MIKILKISLIIFLVPLCILRAQTQQVVGLRDNTPVVFAFENARIYASSGNIVHEGTVVVRDGIIEKVGKNVSIPDDAWVYDLKGKNIYPGFIEIYSDIGLPHIETTMQESVQDMGISGVYEELISQFFAGAITAKSHRGAYHWNPHVRSWYDAAGHFKYDEGNAEKLRSKGFTLAHTIPPHGIFKGQTALVSLGKGTTNELVTRTNVLQAMSFQISREFGRGYPTSLMGVISLIRQTLNDTQWYLEAQNAYHQNPIGQKQPEKNLALAALIEVANGNQPVVFTADDELAVLRAMNIAREFDLDIWVKVSGKEYRRLEAITTGDFPLIVPLNFPKKPDVDNFDKTIELSLESLMHWELAPENPARIFQSGANMVLTSAGIDKSDEFFKQLRQAVKHGLPEYAAIDALTINPARLLQIDKTHGTIEQGKKADFVITDGNIFDSVTKIETVWINGKKYLVDKPHEITAKGKWEIIIKDTVAYHLKLDGTVGNYEGKFVKAGDEFKLKNASFDKQRISFIAEDVFDISEGVIRMSAQVSEKAMYGIGEMPSGEIFNWKAKRIEKTEDDKQPEEEKKDEEDELELISSLLYPSMEYGITETPIQKGCLLITNATLWTQGSKGIIENGDMLVRNGIIVNVGSDLRPPRNCEVVDVDGKHVTPGLIDPHLHASIAHGVNEVGNAITSETRIQDVLNPDNVWIYRLLAGGLTTANLLHGSANPIGGQDAVIKLRWGSLPDEMLFEGAKPGLKMALGENVKGMQTRYPNTRMGTDQIIRDAFQAALDYKAMRDQKHSLGTPYRKDLQLEALLEVLEGDRIVHAHAYRHDEMIKLIRIAEEFGFKITSFEHTVEGYKIADVLREHGAAAIVWTDWSSFKMEAYDAIIYNARLLSEQGVLTSLHSDNTRLATRMHWEAGKIVGTGVDEIEAMNMITINPARILGIEHMAGSLEKDKHADFVIWSEHPLNGFAYAKQTWIDGRKYFDREQDRQTLKEVLKQKNELINK